MPRLGQPMHPTQVTRAVQAAYEDRRQIENRMVPAIPDLLARIQWATYPLEVCLRDGCLCHPLEVCPACQASRIGAVS